MMGNPRERRGLRKVPQFLPHLFLSGLRGLPGWEVHRVCAGLSEGDGPQPGGLSLREKESLKVRRYGVGTASASLVRSVPYLSGDWGTANVTAPSPCCHINSRTSANTSSVSPAKAGTPTSNGNHILLKHGSFPKPPIKTPTQLLLASTVARAPPTPAGTDSTALPQKERPGQGRGQR